LEMRSAQVRLSSADSPQRPEEVQTGVGVFVDVLHASGIPRRCFQPGRADLPLMARLFASASPDSCETALKGMQKPSRFLARALLLVVCCSERPTSRLLPVGRKGGQSCRDERSERSPR
jgi:hypothetical protein